MTPDNNLKVPQPLELAYQYNFTKDMQAREMVPETHWVSKENASASTKESLALGIPPGTPVGRYSRLRLADSIPIAFETACVSSDVIADSNLVDDSLYETLKQGDALPVRALQTLSARSADQKIADMLQVPEGTAVLYMERRGFDQAGRCTEFTRYWYRVTATASSLK